MLSAAQIDEFYQRGYVILRKIFSAEEIGEMESAIARLQHQALGLEGKVEKEGSEFVIQHGLLERVSWAGAAEPVLLRYGRDARLTSPAAQILESYHAHHLINQVHLKLPGGGFYRWHQDSGHRGYGTADWEDVNGKGSYVQTIIAVDEATKDNGPLMFIPYSCKAGHLDLPYDKNKQTVSDKFNPADAVPALMQPGDVAFFGPYTIHGSEVNTSDKPRRVFINGFAYPGANRKKYPGRGELVRLV
ncbi:MAG: phytanoyl-CoA dioxygenase family protein [Nanoarchaeota archaeon]|nr:phytanoyl-CoA dioxygenase family protein [Nanoarchaeota archaeon]